jgi:hypothetical protein
VSPLLNEKRGRGRPLVEGEIFMVKKVTALLVALMLPVQVSAGPITEAIAKAGRDLANGQREEPTRSRTRFWTGIALISGGGLLTALGSLELGDDETGPDDGEDVDDSDDGEDSDGWGNKAMIGGGIAAAALGGVLLFTGQRKSGPVVSIRPHRVMVRHTVSF